MTSSWTFLEIGRQSNSPMSSLATDGLLRGTMKSASFLRRINFNLCKLWSRSEWGLLATPVRTLEIYLYLNYV